MESITSPNPSLSTVWGEGGGGLIDRWGLKETNTEGKPINRKTFKKYSSKYKKKIYYGMDKEPFIRINCRRKGEQGLINRAVTLQVLCKSDRLRT